jgi:hypothetical protein
MTIATYQQAVRKRWKYTSIRNGLVSSHGQFLGCQEPSLYDFPGTNHGTNTGVTWNRNANGILPIVYAGTTGSYTTCGVTGIPAPGSQITVHCWVIFSGSPQGSGRRNRTVDRYYHFAMWQGSTVDTGAGQLTAEYFVNQTTSNNFLSVRSSTNPTVGALYHLAITYNGTSLTFYINGVSAGSSSSLSSVGTPAIGTKIAIGNGFNASNTPDGFGMLNGQIFESGIWNRALSAGEISWIYYKGIGAIWEPKKDNNFAVASTGNRRRRSRILLGAS